MRAVVKKVAKHKMIAQHDRYQFETRFEYVIHKKKKSKSFPFIKDQNYYTDVYFFIPKLMGINADTYKQIQFYEDNRILMQFREPIFNSGEFTSAALSKNGLLKSITFQMKLLMEVGLLEQAGVRDELARLIKHFACTFVGDFKGKIDFWCDELRRVGSGESFGDEENQRILERIESLLEKYFYLLKTFSKIRSENKNQDFHANFIEEEILAAERYSFYMFKEGLAYLLDTLNGTNNHKTCLERLKSKLKIWSRYISIIEKQHNITIVDENSSTKDREVFLSNLGNLKKYLNKVLYIKLQPNRQFLFRSQLSYMSAAAIAAFWYFIANVMIFSYFPFGGFGSFGGLHSFIGLGGMSVLFAFVIAYVLKDRIKEISRIRLRQGIFGKKPDRVYDLVYEAGQDEKVSTGLLSETVSFVQESHTIPEEIRKIRGRSEIWNEEEQVDVLFYRTKVEIKNTMMKRVFSSFYSITHRTRFSVRRFLTKLDDPVQNYLILNRAAKVKAIEMPKHYYIGVAVRSYTEEKMEPIGFDYQVLVVNKNGLVRVDEIASSVRRKNNHQNGNA